jgi:hypothetical protein
MWVDILKGGHIWQHNTNPTVFPESEFFMPNTFKLIKKEFNE